MINEKGCWLDNNLSEHRYDKFLNKELINILNERNVKTIIDFGCGPGEYSWEFSNNGFECDCCDGNPHTPQLSNNKCFVLDLSNNVDLNKKYDCVLSLEVGEHIPREYEDTFVTNLIRHSKNLIILSWAIIHQGGYGHVNEKPNDYITHIFDFKGYKRITSIEQRLRDSAELWWFKNTIMVFEKK